MPMTMAVTRNASPRMRGFLASVMLELAPGVYSSPRLSPAVRERIWAVLEEWTAHEQDTSVVLLWQERKVPGGQAVRILGNPPIDLVEVDGLVLTRRPLRRDAVLDSAD